MNVDKIHKIKFSTEAKGLMRRTPKEVEDEAQIKAVVMAQPHRRGSPDADDRDESALGRLCKTQKWSTDSFQAGVRYGEIVRLWRLSEGFYVPSHSGARGEVPTDEQREACRIKVQSADELLRSIKLRLPSVMVSLCYDDREVYSNDWGIIGSGLAKLQVHFFGRVFFHQPA